MVFLYTSLEDPKLEIKNNATYNNIKYMILT